MGAARAGGREGTLVGGGKRGLGRGLLVLRAGPMGAMAKRGLAAGRARCLLTPPFSGIGREGCQSPPRR